MIEPISDADLAYLDSTEYVHAFKYSYPALRERLRQTEADRDSWRNAAMTVHQDNDKLDEQLRLMSAIVEAAEAAVANDHEWSRFNLGTTPVPESDEVHTTRMEQAIAAFRAQFPKEPT